MFCILTGSHSTRDSNSRCNCRRTVCIHISNGWRTSNLLENHNKQLARKRSYICEHLALKSQLILLASSFVSACRFARDFSLNKSQEVMHKIMEKLPNRS